MSKNYLVGHCIENEGNTIAIQLDCGKIALFFRDLDKQKIAKDLKINERVKVYTKSTMFGEIYSRATRIK